jgi:hypothetical protein
MLQLRSKFLSLIHPFSVMHLPMMIQNSNNAFAHSGIEPSLQEMLAEPMVRELMAKDGVKAQHLHHELELIARAVAASRMVKIPA